MGRFGPYTFLSFGTAFFRCTASMAIFCSCPGPFIGRRYSWIAQNVDNLCVLIQSTKRVYNTNVCGVHIEVLIHYGEMAAMNCRILFSFTVLYNIYMSSIPTFLYLPNFLLFLHSTQKKNTISIAYAPYKLYNNFMILR